jgi:hypothetical protein
MAAFVDVASVVDASERLRAAVAPAPTLIGATTPDIQSGWLPVGELMLSAATGAATRAIVHCAASWRAVSLAMELLAMQAASIDAQAAAELLSTSGGGYVEPRLGGLGPR